MITPTDSVEDEAKGADMSPEQPASAPTHAHQGIFWLVIGHIVVGVMGVCVAYLAGFGPTLRGGAFVGLVFSQVSLLGIWGGLGTSSWLKRLIGVVIGVTYLVNLLGIGVHETAALTFIIVVVATSFVLVLLLIVRCLRVVIHVRLELLLLVLTSGVVGVLPVGVLATKRPAMFSVGLVVVGACAGYCFGRGVWRDEGIWATATAAEAMAVVVSLLVVRSGGYRLVRLPSRRQMEKSVSQQPGTPFKAM